jgi:hypothetical protein
MPLKRVLVRPGVARENTRYLSENVGPAGQDGSYTAGWYDCDKIRFRSGSAEKIGGWVPYSTYYYVGTCRSLNNWVTLGGETLIGVGTNLKFYVNQGGIYYNITPIRSTVTLTNPFATTNGSPIVEVTDAAGGFINGDFVTFSGASPVGGLTLNGEYQITKNQLIANKYTITASANATSTVAAGGGTVTAVYQVNVGPSVTVPLTGWGSGGWGTGTWGFGTASTDSLRIWSQSNFGEDLVFAPRGGGLYYWDASGGVANNPGVNVTTLAGASDVPTKVNIVYVSDISRFVFCFGCNDIASATLDPMLIRWSAQESVVDWTPSPTNSSGSLRLSQGSSIRAIQQSREELLVWTDAALYSLQFLGGTEAWGAKLVGENISVASQNAVALASGTSYWMGVDKFYKYDGRTQTLRCDLRQYIFSDINQTQLEQIVAGTNEGFNEIWWFYCSADSLVLDRYAVYNYLEDIWYYGNLGRTAWLDSGLQSGPIAATYSANLVSHEVGNDDNVNGVPAAMESYITSAEFDLDDGHKFSFVWRMLPDVTFRGSNAANPAIVMSLLPLKNSGSGYTTPASVGGSNLATVTRTVSVPVEQFTGQIYTRIRARQMSIKISSTALGVAWQLGAPRLDIRQDGSR